MKLTLDEKEQETAKETITDFLDWWLEDIPDSVMNIDPDHMEALVERYLKQKYNLE